MKKIFFLFLFIGWSVCCGAQVQTYILKSVYTTGCQKIATDSLGNMYVTGYFHGELFLNHRYFLEEKKGKYFVLKYTPAGEISWALQLVYPVQDLLIDDGHLYLLGQFRESITIHQQTLWSQGNFDTYLASLNLEGQTVWIKHITNIQDALAGRLSCDRQHNVYISGSFTGEVTFEKTVLHEMRRTNIYLVKYNVRGDFLWVRQATGGFSALTGIHVWAMTTDGQGNILLTGGITGIGVFGNRTINSSKESFYGEGWIYNSDIFLAKYTKNGQLLWVKNIAHQSHVQDMVADSNGSVYLTGYFEGSDNMNRPQHLGVALFGKNTFLKVSKVQDQQPVSNMFLAKYSPLGNLIWVKKSEGQGASRGISLYADTARQKIYVGGFFYHDFTLGDKSFEARGEEKKGNDLYIACYQANGAFVWAKSLGGDASEGMGEITVDSMANIYLSGRFKKQAVFENTLLQSKGSGSNGFIIKYSN